MKFCKDYDINMSIASAFEKNVHSMRVQYHAQKVVCILQIPKGGIRVVVVVWSIIRDGVYVI